MSEKEDRFQGVDKAIDRVREELDEAVEESKEAGSSAAKEVREAIDDLEERLSNLRKGDEK
jgi:signal transduction histidine kinase